jgi:hypothetical protein
MAESHPFANAGLGMFGQDVGLARQMSTPEIQTDKDGKPLNPIGMGIAALLQAFGGGTKPPDFNTAPQGSVPPTQYEPSSAFPEILQQQYTSPYTSGGGQNQIWGNKPMENPMYGVPPSNPNMPMAGFKNPNQTSTQPQTNTSGNVFSVDLLWR